MFSYIFFFRFPYFRSKLILFLALHSTKFRSMRKLFFCWKRRWQLTFGFFSSSLAVAFVRVLARDVKKKKILLRWIVFFFFRFVLFFCCCWYFAPKHWEYTGVSSKPLLYTRRTFAILRQFNTSPSETRYCRLFLWSRRRQLRLRNDENDEYDEGGGDEKNYSNYFMLRRVLSVHVLQLVSFRVVAFPSAHPPPSPSLSFSLFLFPIFKSRSH